MYVLEEYIRKIINNINELKKLTTSEKECQLKVVLRIIELLKTIYLNGINIYSFHYSYCVFVKKYLETKMNELFLLFKKEDNKVERNNKYIKLDNIEDDCKITYDNQNIQCIVIEDDENDKKYLTHQINYSKTKIVKNTNSQKIGKKSQNDYSVISKNFLKRNIKDFIKMLSN